MFKLVTDFTPSGDQPQAIKKLIENFDNGITEQILLGATGTGKTFTIANIIKDMGKKTLVLAPNKTLAGQLYGELKALFPMNRVEYFISYYDYYQPEAYVVSSDTFIEKDASINDEIDELRHSATSSLLDRDDVIVVASVSCIYGIGDPEVYKNSLLFARKGESYGRNNLINKLVELLYERNDFDFHRGTFRVRGDVIEIIPASLRSEGIRISFFGDEIEEITKFDVLTGKSIERINFVSIYPATHFMTDKERLKESIKRIEDELEERVNFYNENDKFLEAQRISMRTKYDLEMLREIGTCSGVENYSRHLSLRAEGETPATLIDFFGNDFLLIVDESHVTIPQVGGMYAGDRSRKTTLVEHGFRLPSALDNRPLNFKEFESKLKTVIYLSATPGNYELEKEIPIIEQIIRPTYLLDPEIEIRPSMNQMNDLYFEIKERVKNNERTLVTTLTIRSSEELTSYFKQLGLKVAYLHSEIKALERISILRELRLGKYDCLIGINLLREGLDLPEVSLVAILDADKQGFLRSDRSLVQTIGRAARNQNGKVIMYADEITKSMDYAINETNRRRRLQEEYNNKYNVKPVTVIKDIRENISNKEVEIFDKVKKGLSKLKTREAIKDLEIEMNKAAKELNFEKAAELRDIIFELRGK